MVDVLKRKPSERSPLVGYDRTMVNNILKQVGSMDYGEAIGYFKKQIGLGISLPDYQNSLMVAAKRYVSKTYGGENPSKSDLEKRAKVYQEIGIEYAGGTAGEKRKSARKKLELVGAGKS